MVAARDAPLTMYLVGNENKTASNPVQRNEGEAINGPDLWDPSMAACSPYLKGSMIYIYILAKLPGVARAFEFSSGFFSLDIIKKDLLSVL